MNMDWESEGLSHEHRSIKPFKNQLESVDAGRLMAGGQQHVIPVTESISSNGLSIDDHGIDLIEQSNLLNLLSDFTLVDFPMAELSRILDEESSQNVGSKLFEVKSDLNEYENVPKMAEPTSSETDEMIFFDVIEAFTAGKNNANVLPSFASNFNQVHSGYKTGDNVLKSLPLAVPNNQERIWHDASCVVDQVYNTSTTNEHANVGSAKSDFNEYENVQKMERPTSSQTDEMIFYNIVETFTSGNKNANVLPSFATNFNQVFSAYKIEDNVVFKSLPLGIPNNQEHIWNNASCLVDQIYVTSTTNEHGNVFTANYPKYSKVPYCIEPDMAYTFRTAAINNCEQEERSDVSMCMTNSPGLAIIPKVIKIQNSRNGIILTWKTPSTITGPILEYSVSLAVQEPKPILVSSNFLQVYCGPQTSALISFEKLGKALIDRTKGHKCIVFRICARNKVGYGRPLQIKWFI